MPLPDEPPADHAGTEVVPSTEAAPLPPLPVELEWDAAPVLHLAAQQNGLGSWRRLVLRSTGDQPIEELEVELSADPAFAAPWSQTAGLLPAQGSLALGPPEPSLHVAELAATVERVRGAWRVEVRAAGFAPRRVSIDVALLPYDHWPADAGPPELLAAFVLPNHPAVGAWLEAAAAQLDAWQAGALDGYQSGGRDHALRQVAAVYAALAGRSIRYANPPASFERAGQKVRTPDRIEEQRLATCLDLALAAAASLEQAGLNALVVLVRGHAFAGAWLEKRTFPEAVVHDGAALAKRAELGELVLFDPTLVTAGPEAGFEQARAAAQRRMAALEEFEYAVDVTRARRGGVSPLPLRAAGVHLERARADAKAPNAAQAAHGSVPSAPAPSFAPAEAFAPLDVAEAIDETPATRLERWKRRLLDLTLRNRLLHFRPGKRALQLHVPDLADFEDRLQAEQRPILAGMPREFEAAAQGDAAEGAAAQATRRVDPEVLQGLARAAIEQGSVLTRAREENLGPLLTEIWRSARDAEAEGGATGLYLALGMLEWREEGPGGRTARAPLVLLPVRLVRGGAGQSFRLELGEDEARFNSTLLAKLEQDHGVHLRGVDPLPADAAGVDVARALLRVREAVAARAGWRVHEEAWLSFFTFTKFLMWRDLDAQAESLLESPVVRHLVERPGAAFDPDWNVFQAGLEDLDEALQPSDLVLPALADSSQIGAVLAAHRGKSFVLEGPPGTGKSQTITNLIAHLLAEGRTVLFVSEKIAALEVVQRRLEQLGLGDAFLELHSNRASKAAVAARIKSSLEAAARREPAAWGKQAREVGELRDGLAAYVRALHAPRPADFSLFAALERLSALRAAPRIDLGWREPERLGAEELGRRRRAIDEASEALGEVGSPAEHALAGVGLERAGAEVEARLADALERLSKAIEGAAAAEPWLVRFGGSCQAASIAFLGWAQTAARTLAGLSAEPDARVLAARLLPLAGEIESQTLDRWCEALRRAVQSRAEALVHFEARFFDLDLVELRGAARAARAAIAPIRWWKSRGLRTRLLGAARSGAALPLDDMESAIEAALAARDADAEAKRLREAWPAALAEAIGPWPGPAPADVADLALFERARDLVAELRHTLGQGELAQELGAAALTRAFAGLAQALAASAGSAETAGGLERERAAAEDSLGALLSAHRAAGEAFAFAREDAWFAAGRLGALDALRARCERLGGGLERLDAWTWWRRARTRLIDAGSAALVEAMERGDLPAEMLSAAFERSFLEAWAEAVRASEPALAEFYRGEHEARIERFRQADARLTELARDLVVARVSARAPGGADRAPEGSELGTLRREAQKRRGHMPLRRLLEEAGPALLRLKPCFLMSPISVAQYLPPGKLSFDVVVFDEASQIPTWDAIGAIARGRQAIVVGDSRQLPPTTFFERGVDDEEPEEGVVEDLESILDECRAANLPALDLAWHYRSRHESLIAFSNRRYYQGKLLTFPAAQREGLGVSWCEVPDGVYEKGSSRRNRREAEVLVEEVLARLSDPERSRWSIGVVTFNQAQQRLIEDLFDAARRANPAIEPFFVASEDRPEPVFVKNLENVQGDERDVILFSITYGPDAQGRVAMHFGPLNQEGGERRLNVAVTRARREMVVVSTLRADRIDLGRTRARGVADLKAFLSFAERGHDSLELVLAGEGTPGDGSHESPLEEEVAERLRARGYELHTQVGVSGYRIDLGVVDPDAPGRYLVGIECDGARYHSARSARDRDRLRQLVLEGLGWRLLRVWSTDWWRQPERETERLVTAIERLVASARPFTASESSGDSAAAQSPEPEPYAASPSAASPDEVVLEAALQEAEPEQTAALEPLEIQADTSEVLAEDGRGASYRVWKPRRPPVPQESFYEAAADAALIRAVGDVVALEGPVHADLAITRVVRAVGFGRVTQKARERMGQLLVKLTAQPRGEGDDLVLWPKELDPERWRGYRLGGEDPDSRRGTQELPMAEVANAAEHLLEVGGACPPESLLVELRRLFGLGALTSAVQARFEEALDQLLREGRATRLPDGRLAPAQRT